MVTRYSTMFYLKFLFPLWLWPLTGSLALLMMSQMALACGQITKTSEEVERIARYSTIIATPLPGQIDLLRAKIRIDFPDQVSTVGDALHWLLKDSGYRLVPETALGRDARHFLRLPLPAIHRQFEALPLDTIIGALIGPGFVLVQDPLHRLLSVETCPVVSGIKSTFGACQSGY